MNKLMTRSVLSGGYFGSIFLLGLAAVVRMIDHPGLPDWNSFVVLLLMACLTSSMKVRLPGTHQSASLSFFFCFAAIVEQPPSVALFIAAVSRVFEDIAEREDGHSASQFVFDIATAAVSILATSLIYRYHLEALGLHWALSTGIAALAYYVVSSSISAIQIAIVEESHFWKVWEENFFWFGPVYMITPIGVGIAEMLTGAATHVDSVLALAVTFAGYFYLKSFFARLHDRHDHLREVAEVRQRAIETLAVAIEAKDGSTAGHLQRVKRYATDLARKLGCKESEIRTLELAAVLHDIGKVGVPDYILTKPGKLTQHEFNQVARHTTVGAEIVSAVKFSDPVDQVVAAHHEHWDGSGYPQGLAGKAIPRLARILTVVDCFDALISDRPYRPALSVGEAIEIMRQQRGKILDPDILDSFLKELPMYITEIEQELKREPSPEAVTTTARAAVAQHWMEDGHGNDNRLQVKNLEILSHTPDRICVLYDILNALGSDLQFDQSLKRSLEALRTLIPFHKAGVFSLQQNEYALLQGLGIPDHCLSRLTLSAEDGLFDQAATCGKILVADASASEAFSGPASRYFDGTKSILVAPLIADGRVVGSLLLCAAEAGIFDEQQRLFVSLLTGKLASTLSLAHAVHKVSLEAATDETTSLPNARAAFRRLEAELNRAARDGQSVGVLFMDLDGLKPVNDSYGHAAGDQLLMETARILKSRFRSYDFVARVGGDEFLAIVTGISSDGLETLVESLKRVVAQQPVTVADGVSISTRISIGFSVFPDDSSDPEELVYLSDQRMYQNKEQARSETAELVRLSREITAEAS